MPPMSANKNTMTVVFILVLMVIGGVMSWFLRSDLIEVGLDSSLSHEAKRTLFQKYSHETTYPEGATEVCFRLEPGLYKDGDVYGEYVRFKADDTMIDSFVESTLGLDSKTETPTDYMAWHQGVGDYPWWRPMSVENPEFYEDQRKFITVDRSGGIVYYSYVRSYSVLKGVPSSPVN